MTPDPTYVERLNEEAAVWGAVAADQASSTPPDWAAHRRLRFNLPYVAAIDALLDRVRPGMRVLELGCGAGSLTVAMARRGAIALGVDIAAPAIQIARAYAQAHAPTLRGSATYEIADVNHQAWPAQQFDLVVAKGILHHLVHADQVVARVHAALIDGGWFWISDNSGLETTSAAVAAGSIMFVLPTHVSYTEKWRGLRRFGREAPERIKASMEARGLSPFEGVGRAVDWTGSVARLFDVVVRDRHAAITGYIAAQLRGPDAVAIPGLRLLRAVDIALVRAGLLHSTGVTILARKPIRPR